MYIIQHWSIGYKLLTRELVHFYTNPHTSLLFYFIFLNGLLFKIFLNFIYLSLAALGLHCCTRAFSSCGEWGLLFVAVHRLLIAVSSLAAEHGLQAHGLQQLQCVGSVVAVRGLSSCGTWAQLLCGMWDLPRPGIQPMSPALAGGFLTTVPPGKPHKFIFFKWVLKKLELD